MQLTDLQTDALTEVINIGHGRAAAALSEMTGYRVLLSVPSVSVVPLVEVGRSLRNSLGENVVCVTQTFSGVLAGNAMLLVNGEAGEVLAGLLDSSRRGEDSVTSGEILAETGNVLLNACLGAFGNLLEIQISFTVPTLAVDSVPGIMRSINIQGAQLSHAVIAQTQFRIANSQVSGVLMIIVGLTSLECVLRALEQW